MDSTKAPDGRSTRYPRVDVSRGLIFDFGLPSLWRRVLALLQRARHPKRVRNLASG